MILVEASARVLPNFVRQVIYNVVYPLGSDRRWLGSNTKYIKEEMKTQEKAHATNLLS